MAVVVVVIALHLVVAARPSHLLSWVEIRRGLERDELVAALVSGLNKN